jgi:hypothetical protein
MPVVPLSLDPNAEARALLNFMLRHGDIVGIDHAGRTILQLAVDPWTLDRLAAFDADATDLEDSDSEPDGPAVILDLVPPKRVSRASRIAQALALVLLLVTVPRLEAGADQAAVVAPLPMSTAQAPQQCCRVCRKGKACGNGCISAEKQCKKDRGCATATLTPIALSV